MFPYLWKWEESSQICPSNGQGSQWRGGPFTNTLEGVKRPTKHLLHLKFELADRQKRLFSNGSSIEYYAGPIERLPPYLRALFLAYQIEIHDV